jgi:hypothetical protein
MIGGRYEIFALEAESVPRTWLGRLIRTLVASRLSGEVRITGPATAAFRKPPFIGLFSILRRILGVRSTPLGSINLKTPQFMPNTIYAGGALRQATQFEIARFALHQFMLDYGIDALLYATAGAYGWRLLLEE